MLITHRVALGPHHLAAGRTRHVVQGEVVARPVERRIGVFLGSSDHYLLAYDATGAELSDTLHASVADAMAQVRFELEVQEHEWERVGA